MTEARPFNFDTDFGQGPPAAPKARRVFLAQEVEQIREAAHREGETGAVAAAEAQQVRLLSEIADAAKTALGALAQVAREHRAGSADLALAAARVIAGAALERFPEEPIKAALEALAHEVEAQPRLVIRLPDAGEKLASAIEATLADAGFAGHIAFRPDPDLPVAGFAIEWADGRAAFDPQEAERRIAESFEAAIAAEGLHGEALGAKPNSEDT